MKRNLNQVLQELQSRGLTLQLHPAADGWVFLVISQYPLPDGKFNQQTTDILVKISPAYPAASLDMFWTDETLRLANGQNPLNTNVEENLGQRWLRFSWHPAGWRPGTDNLSSYIAFIEQRFAMGS